MRHANDDHNLDLEQVIDVIEDASNPKLSNTADAALQRFVYQRSLNVEGYGIVLTISVVVQKTPDSENLAPDRYHMGLITGYCNGGIPDPFNYLGICPDGIPPLR